LRRTALRTLLQQGMSEQHVMLLYGHRTRHMLDRYPILHKADLQRAKTANPFFCCNLASLPYST
jgi:hypothetical protein